MPTPLVQKIMDWYASLSPSTLPQITSLYAIDARFKDPFNEVVGVEAIAKIFEHMFASTEAPRFIFEEVIEQGQKVFLTWEFHFGLRGKNYVVKGGSMLTFNEQGMITDHRDYWDAAEELWEKLPIVGTLVGWLRHKFKVQT
ncbi:nuclear transport factor 2 family protein [Undibacterium fentianense]|uniref:Nuclear transport factor 2 family protein n=1 Tax=Undibacterium fentianense TaxID=2828728 RepID=A0A941DZN4_9BURK|nr:nuclear transport factor 2 family protein [Undibacterium fentianense]MBR7798606.1 nuclear transport factor 2 family protein [Undibacterium fentianense]